uniref:Protein broad-minded n=2 Tax=Mesocestoides corti TaxID=53468 RepID=A0A5K3ER29_MESCO
MDKMNDTLLFEEIINQRVERFLGNYEDLSNLAPNKGNHNLSLDIKKLIESSQFQEFRKELIRDISTLINKPNEEGVKKDSKRNIYSPSECAQTTPSRNTCSYRDDEGQDTSRTCQLSGLGFSFTSSVTQDGGCMFPNQSQLMDLAQSLDPRCCDLAQRREALRQIISLPVLDTQTCEAWTAAADTPTAGKNVFEGYPSVSSSVASLHSPSASVTANNLSKTLSTYSIRLGIYDALADEDEELNLLALKFVSKAFTSTLSNVKECYVLLADYLEENFTADKITSQPLSLGLDINKPEILKLLRAFSLLHEFHKQLPHIWVRYPEMLMKSLMDRCLALMMIGCLPTGVTFGKCITPLHLISLLDPRAEWISEWTRGAHGCRVLLNKLSANKEIIAVWMTSCIRFLTRNPVSSRTSRPGGIYASSHIQAAHFLHSLHALTRLLCYREAHSKLFPVAVSKSVLQKLSEPAKVDLVTGTGVSIRTFMRLLIEFILSLNYEDTSKPPGFSLKYLVGECFHRLSTCPSAVETCFELNLEATAKKKKTSVGRAQCLNGSECGNNQSAISLLSSRVYSSLGELADLDEVSEKKPYYENICTFAAALANICSTAKGRAYFNGQKALSHAQPIARAISRCLDLMAKVDAEMIAGKRQLTPAIQITAKISAHLLQVFISTFLSPEGWPLRGDLELHWRVLESWKLMKLRFQERSSEALNADQSVTAFQKSLENFVLTLLGTPKGLEVIRRSDLLNECTQYLLVQNLSCDDGDTLISQIATSVEGFRCLTETCLVERRLREMWKVLECWTETVDKSSSDEDDTTLSYEYGDGERMCNNLLIDGKEQTSQTHDEICPALWPVDVVDNSVQKPFNRLISLFPNWSVVLEALKEARSDAKFRPKSENTPQAGPKSLLELIDSVIMLDSPTKLSQLCRPEETMVFGLRFLSILVSSLDTFLLLESNYGVIAMLLNGQRRSAMAQDNADGTTGRFLIDEGVIERNYLLVKCSVIGGPNERALPPRNLCKHSQDPYPCPILTKVNPSNLGIFTNKHALSKRLCSLCPCHNDVGLLNSASHSSNAVSFTTIVAAGLRQSGNAPHKLGCQILFKLPRLRARLRTLARYSSQLNTKNQDTGCLFEACLRALGCRTTSDASSLRNDVNPSLLPAWEEAAINLIINYGRRVQALDGKCQEAHQRQDMAGLLTSVRGLFCDLKCPAKGPNDKIVDCCEDSPRDFHDQQSKENFRPFDWFVAVMCFVFGGNASRAFDFLARFSRTGLSKELWFNLGSHVKATSRAETPSSYCNIFHIFEVIFSRELPLLFNTFRLSGYLPSKILSHWLSQYFLNYLDWPEIQDFVLLCFVYGSEAIILTGVAIMRHLKPRLLAALQSQSHMVVLMEQPLHGFRFVDNLEFMETLSDKYNEYISAGLSNSSEIE